MADLKASDGVLEMTIQITRKETGKVEEYKLKSLPDQHTIEDKENGSNTHNSI